MSPPPTPPSSHRETLLRELRPVAAVLCAIGLVVLAEFDVRWRWEDAPADAARPPADTALTRRVPVLPPEAGTARTRPAPRRTLPGTAPLRLPVAGVAPDALTDSFDDPRPGGRSHHAIDIMSPRGTPVVAAAAGRVARLHTSTAGGRSLYQLGPDSAYVYYYAHLQRYADDLVEEAPVRAGDTLGFVGSSGNAPQGTPHLHFAIWRVSDPERVWDGPPVNPYPLLVPAP